MRECVGHCDSGLIRWVFCALFSDNNYKGPSRLIRSIECLSRPPIGTNGGVWHMLRCEKKKHGQCSQSLFIKPRSDRKSISVACNYSHADSVKKAPFLLIIKAVEELRWSIP